MNLIKTIKTILISSKEIIITYILSYILIIISCLIYTLISNQDLTNFINTTCSYILIIFYIITSIYLYKKNPQSQSKLSITNYFPLILLGISIATLLNMLIFLIIPPQTNATLSIPLAIISSGIIGPIYEEILFRHILYNRLKKQYATKKALLLTTATFALIHLSPIKIIYAFILSLFLNLAYERHQNIIAPILIHMAANTIVIFLSEYNTYILLLSIVSMIISIKLNFNYKIK